MSEPLLSVLFITYNHEKYLRQSLDSVMSQKTDFDFEVVVGERYSGWNFSADSELREVLRKVLSNRGKELVERATHGGLETGIFKGLIPDMDIITYGPIASGEHTPDEKLDLASFDRSYEILCEVLANCK